MRQQRPSKKRFLPCFSVIIIVGICEQLSPLTPTITEYSNWRTYDFLTFSANGFLSDIKERAEPNLNSPAEERISPGNALPFATNEAR